MMLLEVSCKIVQGKAAMACCVSFGALFSATTSFGSAAAAPRRTHGRILRLRRPQKVISFKSKSVKGDSSEEKQSEADADRMDHVVS